MAGIYMQERGVAVRVFGIDKIALVALGLVGVNLATKTGFPDLLAQGISHKQQYWNPSLIGILFGVVDVAVFKLIIHPEPLNSLTPFMQPFPYSVLLYTAGAVETEVIHRLLPIPILMWSIGGLIVKDSTSQKVFWVLAIVSSIIEPYYQLITNSIGLLIFSFINGFIFNFIQVVYFRWYGFLASLFVRLGHYLIWHILFGVITEYAS
ncbi:hypothetical protein Q0590_17805 [Rhodocytophaga aerolata]|uniref:CPBP family intramembrane metalloprotease n=1 Tax=Rhodocytophaga aerolata TaxID=455078 RepID=A0ABT8R9W8_9BACT|nr:hypothetical protein [Rhodocytophaga aerolata]MDO1448134.1 hypothetical protein [Rhodocytophaga aerolata]